MLLTPPPTPIDGISMLSFSYSDKNETIINTNSNKEDYRDDDTNSCDYNNCLPSSLLCSDVKTASSIQDDQFTGGENSPSYFKLTTCER